MPRSERVRARLAIAVLAAVLTGCFEPRVLVVGLDSASWRVLEPLMNKGMTPHIAKLVRSGARAELDCVPADPATACFCPPVWTSVATGTAFASHRIGGFFQPSSMRQSKAIWEIAAGAGVRVVTSNWRGTWPPEPGVDWVLTEPGLDRAARALYDMWAPLDHPAEALPLPLDHPADAYERLGLLAGAGDRPPLWGPYARDRVAMDAVLAIEQARARDEDAAGRRLTLVLIHGPDKVAHLLWGLFQEEMYAPFDTLAYLEEAQTWAGPVTGPAPFGWGPMAGPYLEVDVWLGRLLEVADYDYVVFVSDHGMTRNPLPGLWGQHHVDAPEAHRGIFAVTGPGVRPGVLLDTVSVLDVAPTLAYLLGLPVADDLPGRVVEEAFKSMWLRERPVARVATWED